MDERKVDRRKESNGKHKIKGWEDGGWMMDG